MWKVGVQLEEEGEAGGGVLGECEVLPGKSAEAVAEEFAGEGEVGGGEGGKVSVDLGPD